MERIQPEDENTLINFIEYSPVVHNFLLAYSFAIRTEIDKINWKLESIQTDLSDIKKLLNKNL